MPFFTTEYWNKGRCHEKNQDSLCVAEMTCRGKNCLLAVVCDGIGSIKGSEKVSYLVTEEWVNWFFTRLPTSGFWGIPQSMSREVCRIRERAMSDCRGSKTACTMSVLLLVGKKFFIVHCGDSRIYMAERGVRCLTRDDAVNGKLSAYIGNFGNSSVQKRKGKIRSGDGFLVCSDGFYRKMKTEDMKRVLTKKAGDEAYFKKALAELAGRNLQMGEMDDMSAVLVKVF